MRDAAGQTLFCYDRDGQLRQRLREQGGHRYRLQRDILPDGRLQRLHYPDGSTVAYQHDRQGRIATVTVTPAGGAPQVLAQQIEYAPFGGGILGWRDGRGRPIQQAIWLEDLPIGLLVHDAAIARLHALYPDHLGTPRAALDLQRDAIVWRWELSGGSVRRQRAKRRPGRRRPTPTAGPALPRPAPRPGHRPAREPPPRR